MQTVLITGSAGFIGSSLSMHLLERGDTVIGVDNHNQYYDQNLKESRLMRFSNFSKYKHYRVDITDSEKLNDIFNIHKPKKVVNLAAQAGVRYSIENPLICVQSNIVGFANILETCRNHKIEHLVYASTSSVYGANTKMPLSEEDNTDQPLSVYAASKKSNELMAYTYSYLYKLQTTGLRFFTVYGPWGRPDMALFKFTESILLDKPIDVFNFGHHIRDFTYIDDIINGIVRILDCPANLSNYMKINKQPNQKASMVPWNIYNIGNSRPVNLMDYIDTIEKKLGKKAKLNLLPMQLGDVLSTHADIKNLIQDFNYTPKTSILEGVSKFIDWYKFYYNK
jgi:UDP-glucuronate 4-epimerase